MNAAESSVQPKGFFKRHSWKVAAFISLVIAVNVLNTYFPDGFRTGETQRYTGVLHVTSGDHELGFFSDFPSIRTLDGIRARGYFTREYTQCAMSQDRAQFEKRQPALRLAAHEPSLAFKISFTAYRHLARGTCAAWRSRSRRSRWGIYLDINAIDEIAQLPCVDVALNGNAIICRDGTPVPESIARID